MAKDKWFLFLTSKGELRAFASFSLDYDNETFGPVSDDTGYPITNPNEINPRMLDKNKLYQVPVSLDLAITGKPGRESATFKNAKW
jgi:hypothetical protein